MEVDIKERLDSVINIFDKLQANSSINDKISIIKLNKDNELFTRILRFVYDDFIRSGVSSKTLRNTSLLKEVFISQGFYTIESMLDYIEENNTGSFKTVAQIQAFMQPFSQKEKDFLIDVFSKELKAGITAKTINKSLGKGYIREFSVQLAHPYHKYAEQVPGRSFTLTQKLDGHRSVFIVKNGVGQFYTRKGLPINGLEVQKAEAMKLAEVLGNYSTDYVLDGELVLFNKDDLETKDLFRATSRILRSETADKSDIQYNIFDALPTEEFEQGKSKDTFKVRKQFLSNCMTAIAYDSPESFNHLHLVKDLYSGSDISMIKKLQHKFVEPNGWEGLMLNLNDEYYVTKRTTGLLKIKEFYDADVVCTDVFEGTGRHKGRLGGIVVDYKGYSIKVGSGFTDNEREYYWQHRDKIIGTVVAISYFEETHNQNNDDLSLRFPTLLESRVGEKDATEVSYEV